MGSRLVPLCLMVWTACGPGGSGDSTTVEAADSESESESESESGVTLEPVRVTWLEVAASDYKLELVPEFDPSHFSYEAIADGPDIEVYVDVIVDQDIDGVRVNDVPSLPNGFRTWRSAPETMLVSPTALTVELEAPGFDAPTFEVAVVLP